LEFLRFRNGFISVLRCCPCVEWSPTFSSDGLVSCRTFIEPTALGSIYLSERKGRTPFSTANLPQQATIAQLYVKLNRHHR